MLIFAQIKCRVEGGGLRHLFIWNDSDDWICALLSTCGMRFTSNIWQIIKWLIGNGAKADTCILEMAEAHEELSAQ